MSNMTKSLVWWVAVPLVVASTYLVLRSFIVGESSPFASEIAAAFLGSLLTIAVTGLLIQRQAGQTAAAELKKEKDLKVYQERITVYRKLMDDVRELLVKDAVGEVDQVRLQIQFQQLAFVADQDVLEAAGRCIQVINAAAEDGILTAMDREQILRHFAQLVLRMRSELESGGIANEQSVSELVTRSLEFTQWEQGLREFLASCDPAERDFYSRLLSRLKERRVGYKKEEVGIAVKDAHGRSIVWLFPKGKAKRSQFLVPKDPEGARMIEEVLARVGVDVQIDPLTARADDVLNAILRLQDYG